jgi:hypothetical protein
MGEPEKALPFYERDLAISRETNYQLGIGFASVNIGSALRDLGFLDRSLHSYDRALSKMKETGYMTGVGIALHNIGYVYYLKNDLKKAIRMMLSSINILRKTGHRSGLGFAYQRIAASYIAASNLKRAGFYLRLSNHIFSQIDNQIELANIHIIYVDYYLEKKCINKADMHASIALGLARKCKAKDLMVRALRARGMTLFRMSLASLEKRAKLRMLNRAIHHLQRSLELARRQHMRIEAGTSLRILIEVKRTAGCR